MERLRLCPLPFYRAHFLADQRKIKWRKPARTRSSFRQSVRLRGAREARTNRPRTGLDTPESVERGTSAAQDVRIVVICDASSTYDHLPWASNGDARRPTAAPPPSFSERVNTLQWCTMGVPRRSCLANKKSPGRPTLTHSWGHPAVTPVPWDARGTPNPRWAPHGAFGPSRASHRCHHGPLQAILRVPSTAPCVPKAVPSVPWAAPWAAHGTSHVNSQQCQYPKFKGVHNKSTAPVTSSSVRVYIGHRSAF